jgi:peptide/nickel transport system permease protein
MMGRGRSVWREVRRSRLASAGLLLLLLLGLCALLADVLASDLPIALRWQGRTYLLPSVTRPAALRSQDNQRLRRELSKARGDWAWMPLCEYGPEQQPPILRPPPASPDREHWLGTDDRGRDVFARLIHGSRVSLSVGLISVALNVLCGLILGVAAGYFRGRTDFVISRFIELGLTFPTFFLILVVMGLMERTSLLAIMVVLGLTRWSDVARLVRAEALRLRELDFVLAARAMGAGPLRILSWHVVPNLLGPVLVYAGFGVAGAILTESALSFLGFGAPPPTASWGEVLSQAMEHPDAWWLTICPGVLLFVTITSLNLVGEALRDAIDPRLRDPGS